MSQRDRRGCGRRPPLALAVAVITCAASAAWLRPAHATDFEITSDTVYQSFAVATGYGPESLEYRTRLTESLGFGAFSVGGVRGLSVVARLRYDVDFGLVDECGAGGVLGPAPYAGPTVPNPDPGPPADPHLRLLCGNSLDVTQLYVAGERLFNGWLSFKLGRQWQTDPLGWHAFDGATVTVRFPLFFSLTASAGFETTSGFLLGRSPWSLDGSNVRVDGDPRRTDEFGVLRLDFRLHPAPFAAVGLSARGFGRGAAEVTFRTTFGAPGQVVTTSTTPPTEGMADLGASGTLATVERRLGYAVTYGFTNDFRARLSMVVDLLWPRFDEITAEGSARLLDGRLGVRAGVEFLRPRLSTQSIWYFFDFRPTAGAFARADLRATEDVWLFARLALREYGATWSLAGEPSDTDVAWGPAGEAGVRLTSGRLTVVASATAKAGFAGFDGGATASATYAVRPGRLDVTAQGYLFYYENVLQPTQHGLYGGGGLGVDYRFGDGARVSLLAEDHISPFFASNPRLYALLNLDFWL